MFIAGVQAGPLSTRTLLNVQATLFLVAALTVRGMLAPRRRTGQRRPSPG